MGLQRVSRYAAKRGICGKAVPLKSGFFLALRMKAQEKEGGRKWRGAAVSAQGVPMGYNAPMGDSGLISTRLTADKLWFVVGMALFWPVVSYRIAPGTFVPDYELPVSATYDSMGALGALLTVLFSIVLAAVIARRPLGDSWTRWAVLVSGLASLGSLALSAQLGGSNPWAGALVAVTSSAYVCLLAAGWACRAEWFSPRFAVLACALSLAINIALVALVQGVDLPFSLGRASKASLLAFLSGAALVAWPLRRSSAGEGSWRRSSLLDARSNCSDADNRKERTQGALLGAVLKRSSLLWVFAVLVLYLAFTTVIRTHLSFGLDFEEPLYKSWLSKVVLFLFALGMFAVAWRMNRRSDSGRGCVTFPWIVFVVSCLAVLYFAIVFASYAPLLCHEIIFPSRLYAFFLLWVVALVAASTCGCRVDFAVCVLFLPALGGLRLLACGIALVMPAMPVGGVPTMMLYVVTAFVVTVATFLYLRASFSERTAQGLAGFSGGSNFREGEGSSGSSAVSAAEARREVCRRLGAEHGCTEREVEVLVLLSEGHGQKRIAEELFLSPNTIHSYAKSLYRKLDVHDRQEVIDLVRSAEGK